MLKFCDMTKMFCLIFFQSEENGSLVCNLKEVNLKLSITDSLTAA